MNDRAHGSGPAEDQPDTALVREVEITNKKGLHARASAKFVQTAEQFDASITVTKGSESVGGTSIMGLMMLAAGPGSTVIVKASGNEAAAAIEAVCDLITSRFGEDE